MLGWPALALSMTGLEASLGVDPADLREVVRLAGDAARAPGTAGLSAFVLNAAAPGLRPRDLDRSARKDVAAMLRRAGLTLAGLDLFIPPEHFATSGSVDRAVAAVQAACGLCAEIAAWSGHPTRGVVAIALPRPRPATALAALAAAAEREGVLLADYGWPLEHGPSPAVAHGLDPVAALAAGSDPALLAARGPGVGGMGGVAGVAGLGQARLTDLAATGRVAPGATGARLDVAAYGAGLLASGLREPVVLDLRGVPRQHEAVTLALNAWAHAALPSG